MLVRLEEGALSSSIVYLRNTLGMLSQGVEWISPFTYLHRGMQSISIESSRLYGINIAYALAYSFVSLVFSVLVLERKGVRG